MNLRAPPELRNEVKRLNHSDTGTQRRGKSLNERTRRVRGGECEVAFRFFATLAISAFQLDSAFEFGCGSAVLVFRGLFTL